MHDDGEYTFWDCIAGAADGGAPAFPEFDECICVSVNDEAAWRQAEVRFALRSEPERGVPLRFIAGHYESGGKEPEKGAHRREA